MRQHLSALLAIGGVSISEALSRIEKKSELTHEQKVNIFLRHGVPGMTLKAPRQPIGSTFKRCGCGQRISRTRSRCMACQQEVLRELAEQIDGQELLDAMLMRNLPDRQSRKEMVDALRPYLKFTPGPIPHEHQ